MGMTREDAILCLKGIKNYGRDTFTEQSDWQDSLDMAIKALEQEPILDKIRAKIKALTSNRGFLSCSVDYIHEKIDAVFDKYNAESEDRE